MDKTWSLIYLIVMQDERYIRNYIKSKIVHEIFYFFSQDLGLYCVPFGPGGGIKGLVHKVRENMEQFTSTGVLRRIRQTPDFIIFEDGGKETYLVEVKFHMNILEKNSKTGSLYIAEQALQLWKEYPNAYLFFASHYVGSEACTDFYFGPAREMKDLKDTPKSITADPFWNVQLKGNGKVLNSYKNILQSYIPPNK